MTEQNREQCDCSHTLKVGNQECGSCKIKKRDEAIGLAHFVRIRGGKLLEMRGQELLAKVLLAEVAAREAAERELNQALNQIEFWKSTAKDIEIARDLVRTKLLTAQAENIQMKKAVSFGNLALLEAQTQLKAAKAEIDRLKGLLK